MGTKTMALIQTHQIQAIMTVPERLSFPAQLSNCNLATCWHIELSILGLIHLSISIHFSNSFTCSMKFFLGLALGASCVACATTEKHWCPQRHASVGKLSLGKPAKITFGENKDANSCTWRQAGADNPKIGPGKSLDRRIDWEVCSKIKELNVLFWLGRVFFSRKNWYLLVT